MEEEAAAAVAAAAEVNGVIIRVGGRGRKEYLRGGASFAATAPEV